MRRFATALALVHYEGIEAVRAIACMWHKPTSC
jgi:hypothetical protein